jgi:integrase/recombinase XerD
VRITNKPPKGQKQLYLSKISQHTLHAVKDSYVASVGKTSETYQRNFGLAIRKLEQWWQLVKGEHLPTIHEIQEPDVNDFKVWFKEQPGITHNTVITYLSRLRTLFNYGVRNKIIHESPIKKGLVEGYKKGAQVSLTLEEQLRFQQIADEELTPTLKKTKYIFLFLLSTGMGYGEFKSLRAEHFEQDGDDLIINKERNKTDEPFTILLSNTAKNIFRHYLEPLVITPNDVDPSSNHLPSIEYLGRMLKILAKKAGINKNITSYVARKSFATQWAHEGNNLYYLQMILGHKKPETTMTYVALKKSQMVEYSRQAYAKNKFHNPG